MAVVLRRGTRADAEAAGTICHDAFQQIAARHAFPADFPTPAAAIALLDHVLARADVHPVVAEAGGRVVGSNFLWEGAGHVAGVGPITVDPRAQNDSIGRKLMQAVLERARMERIGSVRLVQAGYHTRSMSLYAKLGFVCREPLATMQGAPLALRIPGHQVRAALESDLSATDALSRRVHGFTRTSDVREAIVHGTASVVEHDGRITGYSTGIGFFGHAVGETTEDVKALIAAAPGFSDPGFLVPTRNAELFRWCLEKGLRMVQPMTLMSMGLYNEPAGAFLPSILF